MLSTNKKKNRKAQSSAAKKQRKAKDYGNDPFFVKKAEESKIFLEKHGFPKDLRH